MKINAILIIGTAASVAVATLVADTNLINLPENYRTTFVRYTSLDKPNPESPEKAKMRYFYVNPEALAAAQVDQSAPAGTMLIMEDHAIERDVEGKPAMDSTGRFIPTDEITNIFVQEKQTGWGAEYADDVRNGEWEYAWFDGTHQRKVDMSMDGCFGCHKGAADTDYNFTFAPFVLSIKK